MAKQDIKAGGAFVELSVRKAKFVRGLRAASERLKAVGGTFRNAGTQLATVGAAITAPFAAGLKIFSSFGDELEKMSRRTGVSVESLSRLQHAAEQSGASASDLQTGIRGMNKFLVNLQRGLSTSVDAAQDLGLSFSDLESLDPESRFKLLADRLAQIEDPGIRAGVAMDIFGRSAISLLPLIESGAGGIQELTDEAERLGIVMSTEDAKAAADFADSLSELKQQVKAAFFQVGAAVAGPITKFARTIQPIMKAVIGWVKSNKSLVAIVAAIGVTLTATGAAVAAFGLAVSGVGAALGLVGSMLGVILSPLGLLGAAVGSATFAFFKFTDAGRNLGKLFRNVFGEIGGIARDTFGGIVDALKSGDIELAGEIAILGLKTAWERVLIEIRKLMDNDFVKAITEAVLMVKEFFVGAFRLVQKFWNSEFTPNLNSSFDESMEGIKDKSEDAATTLKDVFLDAVSGISKAVVILIGNLRSAFAVAEQVKWANAVEKAEEEIQRRRTRIITTMEEIRGSMEDTFARAGLTTAQRVELGRQLTGTKEEHAAGLQQARELGVNDEDVSALEMSAKRLLHLNRQRLKLDDKTLSNLEKLKIRNEAVLEPARREKELLEAIDRARKGTATKSRRKQTQIDTSTPKLKSLTDQLREKVQQAAAGAKETGDDKLGGGGVVPKKPELIAGGSFGTFSAAALGFMGARGMGPQDRIAKNSELTLAEIVRLANNVDKWNQGLESLIPVVVD